MNHVKFTLHDLLEELRIKDIFNVEDVEYAILETGGKISVLKKSAEQAVTASQMNIATNYRGFCVNIIIDGKIMKDNLKLLGKSDEWVKNELKKRNITSIKE